jgi:hypothetical protein
VPWSAGGATDAIMRMLASGSAMTTSRRCAG